MSKVRSGLIALFMIVALTIALPLAAFAGELEARITDDSITTNGRELLGVTDLLPGDSYSTTLSIVNDSAREQKVNFFLDYSNMPEVKEFANIATINISHDGQVVFSGHLSEVASDVQGIHVLNLKPGESDELSFQIELPFEADEVHMDQFATFDWSIHSEAQASASPTDQGGATSGGSGYAGSGFFAKTGVDLTFFVAIAVGLCTFAAVISITARKRARTDKESDNENDQ